MFTWSAPPLKPLNLPPMLNYEMEARDILRRAEAARTKERFTSLWWDALSIASIMAAIWAVLEISTW